MVNNVLTKRAFVTLAISAKLHKLLNNLHDSALHSSAAAFESSLGEAVKSLVSNNEEKFLILENLKRELLRVEKIYLSSETLRGNGSIKALIDHIKDLIIKKELELSS